MNAGTAAAHALLPTFEGLPDTESGSIAQQMKRIFLIGAGRSSTHLIQYLIRYSGEGNWRVRIADLDEAGIRARTGGHPAAEAVRMDALDRSRRREEIAAADLVISMLPASLHMEVVRDCLDFGRNVITPSYIPDEMWALDEEARSRGVLVMNEMGLDPGLDHMSAMRIIDAIRGEGGELTGFESYTGGLVAPESDDNPWHYKITWNPRNVVLAGYGGTARYRSDGRLRFIPYSRLFSQVAQVEVPGYGRFEGYANRDSLKYLGLYGLDGIGTMLRGTLRGEGFCQGWNALVQLGLTDDSFELPEPSSMTWRELVASFSDVEETADLSGALARRWGWDGDTLDRLEWLGIFSEAPLGISAGSPARALQALIESRWKLGASDKDLIVMWHRFTYRQGGELREIRSWLTAEGEDPLRTGMSRTVGLPIGIAARHILNGEWAASGIHLPVRPEFYIPVLRELEAYGIIFHETPSIPA